MKFLYLQASKALCAPERGIPLSDLRKSPEIAGLARFMRGTICPALTSK